MVVSEVSSTARSRRQAASTMAVRHGAPDCFSAL